MIMSIKMNKDKKQEILELLRMHYGFKSLRPGQEKTIDNVLAGKSTLVIMPTGGGKSLCYQLPALVLDGVTIVVSPLISLMKDQVDSLERVGIPATFINSSISLAETERRIKMVQDGYYKLLYIAPERFYNNEFVQALANVKVSLFAIDEAHCISSWGHDFRPSYLKLRDVIKKLGNPIVLALTATATPEVRDDIAKQLELKDYELVITGFARPNLQFGAMRATESNKPQFVIDAINSMPDQSGIIYVSTRAKADQLLSILLENNIEAVGYHAGMEAEDRKWVQDNFILGKAKVIVATNAFGLGIDKPDIRFVIHYDMPGTIEAYYQEAGRAGRDGKPSLCLMLYGSQDRYLQEFFIKGDNPPPEIILEIYDILLSYESDKVLLTYSSLNETLSEKLPDMAIGTSLKILEREGYISKASEKSGNAFLRLNKTAEEIIDGFTPRAKTQREIMQKLHNKFENDLLNGWDFNLEEVAGILGVKKDSLIRLIRKLSSEGSLEYTPPFRGTEINILKRIDKNEVAIDFSALQAKAKSAYKKLDKMENYIYDFGCRQKYILDYFGEENLSSCDKCDNCLMGGGYAGAPEKSSDRKIKTKSSFFHHKESGPKELELEEDISQKAKLPTKLTQLETFDLYNKGMNIEEMAMSRNVKPGTIVQHLCYLIEKKLPIDINKFIDIKKQKKINEIVDRVGKDKLTPIKEELGDDFSWDEIRLVLSSLK